MSSISQPQIEQIIAACRESTAGIAESLNRCFGRNVRIEIGESFPWQADKAPDALDGPGLAVAFQIGDGGMVCLLPATLPLPDWYASSDETDQSRLETLPLEWSVNMLPSELDADQFGTTTSENLRQSIIDSGPAEHATVLELMLYDKGPELGGDSVEERRGLDSESPVGTPASPAESPKGAAAEGEASSGDDEEQATTESPSVADGPGNADAAAKFYLIVPVAHPPIPAEADDLLDGSGVSEGPGGAARDEAGGDPPRTVDAQLLNLPVTVSVRLAEKKIELGQLISLSPGGLITFNKSCDNLLDLYVNNYPFCRGEAIKIGEKFGLKISQIGAPPERERRTH